MESPKTYAMDFSFASTSSMSSPLSELSRSPSPPIAYPSPSSSQDGPEQADASSPSPEDGPPRKRRRTTEPKPRVYHKIDFTKGGSLRGRTTEEQEGVQRLIKLLETRQKIVVVAGAGISVSAGIPDFRSSKGLFKTLREKHKLKASGKHLFDASVYRDDNSTSSFHDMVREMSHLTAAAKPTLFHHMIARLAHEGRLLRLYTQNVDALDTNIPPLATQIPLNRKAPWPKTIQVHGGLQKMVCTKCNHVDDFQPALFDGPEPPSCPQCEEVDAVRTNVAGKRSHGIGKLRPRMVLYNEHNPDDEAIGSVTQADLRTRPDAVVVVGTSLKVPGVRRIVKEMCGVVQGRRDGVTVWVSNGPVPSGKDLENCFDIVVEGDCQNVARIAGLRQWDDEFIGPYTEAETMEKETKRMFAPEVLETPRKNRNANLHGLPTPGGSPHPTVDDATGVRPVSSLKLENAIKRGKSKLGAGKAAKAGLKKPVKLRQTKKKQETGLNSKITQTFKLSKANTAATTTEKKSRPKELKPISPTALNGAIAIRSGSPTASRSDIKREFMTADIDVGDTSFSSISSSTYGGTISPTGAIPKGMQNILHLG